MDKWKRQDEGYKTNWPDGIYEVTNIIFIDKPIEIQRQHSRIIEIINNKVHVDGIKVPGDKEQNKIMKFTQNEFFEVNVVIEYLKEI